MERYRVPDTQSIHRVSGSVFFLNRSFSAARNIRYLDTSLKRSESGPVNVLIFLDSPRIMGCRWWTHVPSRFAGSTIPLHTTSYYQISSSHLTWTTLRVYVVLAGLRWPHQSIKSASSKCRNVCWCINTSNFLYFEMGKYNFSALLSYKIRRTRDVDGSPGEMFGGSHSVCLEKPKKWISMRHSRNCI